MENHFPAASSEPRNTEINQQRLFALPEVSLQTLSMQMDIQGQLRLSEFPKNKAKETTVSMIRH